MVHTNSKNLFIVYLKFKWNWGICISSGNSLLVSSTVPPYLTHFESCRALGTEKSLGEWGLQKKEKSFHQARFTLVLLEFQAYLELCLVLHALGQKLLREHKCTGWLPPTPHPATLNIMKIKMFWMNWKGVFFKGGCQRPVSFFHISWDTSMISFWASFCLLYSWYRRFDKPRLWGNIFMFTSITWVSLYLWHQEIKRHFFTIADPK